jgi:hypothetical protein
VALACGFNFPQTLLDRRDTTLLGLYPRDWMSAQIEDLYPTPTDSLQANERTGDSAADMEKREVDPSRWPQLAAMRAAPDGASAYATGDGLPEATRLYIAGAVEFKAAQAALKEEQDASGHAAAALGYFLRVLQLPATQRAPRAIWASYMAGRVQSLSDDAGAPARAITYYWQCRDLARQGLPDPLGLAVASFGEEARIALKAGDVQHAVELYLEQGARGSFQARNSLDYIASRLVADPELTIRNIQDARIQKLWYAGMLSAGLYGYYFSGPDDAPNSWGARVQRVASVIDRSTASPLDGLAAIAYATGRYELAASFATGVDSPLAAVVRAKLALRDGDDQTAADEFATAITYRDREVSGTVNLSYSAWSELLAENGVLAMSRGDYAAALASLLDAGTEHWLDAAYVAERVLSLEELEQFAQEHVPASNPSSQDAPGSYYWRQYWARPAEPAKALRLLLARRQMREQRFDAALENFRNNDFALDDAHPSLAAVASQYVAAVRTGKSAWTSIGRAQGLFTEAQLAKQFGMELLGYELAPDYYAVGGRTQLYQEPASDSDFITADETGRITANPPPTERFHYRGIAYDLANRAADDLPPRSQAFAAVLCTSLQWSEAGNRMDRARALYQRYVHEAAYVAWSPNFGEVCQAPDFKRARTLLWHSRINAVRAALRPWKIPLELLVAAILIGCGALVVRWKRGQGNTGSGNE